MTQDIEDKIQAIQDRANETRKRLNELLYPDGDWTSNHQLAGDLYAFAALLGQNLGTLETVDEKEAIEALKEGVFQIMEAERQHTLLRMKEGAESIRMKI